MSRTGALLGLATALATLSGAGPALAQNKVKLKLVHGYPETHFLWQQGGKVFADAVAEATKGQVEFEVYPANQLGKEQFSALSTNLAEVGLITPANAGGKLSLTSVTELPGLYQSSCEATGKFWALAKEGGLLNESEYKPNRLHVIYVATVPPYSLMTTSRETATLDALKGLKIRVAGSAMNKTVTALGAAPVQVAGAEMYDALSRGTVDGTIYSRMALNAYKLEPLLKYSVDGIRLGSGSVVMAMSERAWNALPADLQKVVATAGLKAQRHLCEYQDAQEAKASKDLVEKNGWKMSNLSPEQVKLWGARVAEANKAWAAELDASGRKGTQLLEAFTKADPAF